MSKWINMDQTELMGAMRYCPKRKARIEYRQCRDCFYVDTLFSIFVDCCYEAEKFKEKRGEVVVAT